MSKVTEFTLGVSVPNVIEVHGADISCSWMDGDSNCRDSW